MRRDDLYLHDIIEAADHIAAFLAESDFEGFLKSELVQSAVVQKLAIIGEAAASFADFNLIFKRAGLSTDFIFSFFTIFAMILPHNQHRSEEHTSELQSLRHLVCR